MNERKTAREDVSRQPDPAYSRELPKTEQERKAATSGHHDDPKARQENPDPNPNAAPYGATNRHGTDDASRFSTPPPKHP